MRASLLMMTVPVHSSGIAKEMASEAIEMLTVDRFVEDYVAFKVPVVLTGAPHSRFFLTEVAKECRDANLDFEVVKSSRERAKRTRSVCATTSVLRGLSVRQVGK